MNENNLINNNESNDINKTEQTNIEETSNNNRNKNTLIIIIGAIAALIIIIVILIIIIKPSGGGGTTPPDDRHPPISPEEKQEYMDQLNSQEGQDLVQVLYTYGVEIYNNKKYKDLGKDERGIFYATKYDLTLMNYDVSLIPEECTMERPIIYFDVENKLSESYEFEPIVYDVFCDKK